MRPYTLALATLSHGIASATLAGLTLWLASYAPEIRAIALPAYALTIGLAFSGAIGAASLCWQSLQQFARLMAAPLSVES